jgi:hypothetical protein
MAVVINGTTGISGVDGSAGTPALQGGDPDTGIFYGTNTVSIATNGVAAVTVDASGNTTFAAQTLFPDGSVSAPAISNMGDVNTGVYFPAADNVAIATGGVAALTADSSQNVSVTNTLVMGSSFKRNRIINGNMGVWQRSTSSVALTNAVAYGTADRWFAVMDTTAAGTWQQGTSVPTLPNISQYSMRIGRNSSSTSTNTIRMYQIVESVNCYDLAGQTVVVSFYAKAGANYSSSGSALSLQIIQGTGVDQSAATMYSGNWTGTSTTNNSSTITTTWARYTYSFTVGSSTSEIAIGFTYTPTGTAGADDNVYITGVQLEVGSVATPYERQIYSDQLAQCQRYLPAFSGTGQLGAGGNASSNTQAYTTIIFPVPARVAATGMTINAASNFVIGCAGVTSDFTCTAVSASNHSTSGSLILSTVSSGLTAGQVITMRGGGSALMYFTGCEL